MANRLCFDIGLHLDCQNDGLPEKEIQIRHMTMLACVIYDKLSFCAMRLRMHF
jgi:hypothetical protein